MTELSSVFWYLSLFLISTILISFGSDKQRQGSTTLIILGLSIPILLATFREGVGTDFYNYFSNFIDAKRTTFMQYINDNSIDGIGRFLILKIGTIFNNYLIVLAIYSSLTIFIMYSAIKDHRDKIYIGIAFFIFLCIYFPSSLNIMSQFLAIVIVALSFKYIFRNSFVKYLIFITIASLIHPTALVTLPVYFLWDRKNNKLISNLKILFFTIISVLIVLNYQEIIEYLSQIKMLSDYKFYANDNISGKNRDLILKIILFSIVFILRKPLIKYDVRNKLYILLMLFNIIFGFIGFVSPFVKRLALYFGITQVFIIPSIIKLFRDRKDKVLIHVGIFAYAISYFILVYYLIGDADIIPYEFFFL